METTRGRDDGDNRGGRVPSQTSRGRSGPLGGLPSPMWREKENQGGEKIGSQK